MIPKVIHYFWDGEKEVDSKIIDSWKKFCPDYELKKWDCKCLPVDEYPDLKILIENKRYSMLSDFIRHWAVCKFGGFYLDTDIELIKSLDSLRELNSFSCIEGFPIAVNSAASGSEISKEFQVVALDMYFSFDFEELLKGNTPHGLPPEIVVSPYMLTKMVTEDLGIELTGLDTVHTENFTLLGKEYFYPYNWNEMFHESCITENTIGIHLWAKSW